MPELPDVTVYVEALEARVKGQVLLGLRVASPFVVRTFDPPLSAAAGKKVLGVRRLGKRIVFELSDGLFLVVHLMIAGRFKWLDPKAKIPGQLGLAAFDFEKGTLLLTEAATQKRASIHLARSLDEVKPGGIQPAEGSLAQFDAALRSADHTLQPSPTDPPLCFRI